MSLIQKEIADFSVQVLIRLTPSAPLPRRMCWVSGVCFSSILPTSPLCAPRSWRIWQTSMINSRPSAAKFTPFPAIPHFVHKAWHDASERIQKIQYPMLADPTHCLAKDFEVYIEADGLAERGSFIAQPRGKNRGL